MSSPAAPTDRGAAGAAERSPRERLRIGVVEDHDEDFWVLARLLSGRAAVLRWRDADEALAALGSEQADLTELDAFFIDLNLPRGSGLDVVSALRALPGGNAPRVVMLTASGREQDRADALGCGVDRYEIKPARLDDLRAIVARALGDLHERAA